MNTVDELREWARGTITVEIGTELLIRGGYAHESHPWVRYDERRRRHWIDFERIPVAARRYPPDERTFLRIVSSIGADAPVILGNELIGLDDRQVQQVIAALVLVAGKDRLI